MNIILQSEMKNFNLGILTMRTPEGVFEVDFDAVKDDATSEGLLLRDSTWIIYVIELKNFNNNNKKLEDKLR